MDKAALYLRLSKEDVDKLNRGDDSESIINQRLLLTDYAIEHEMQVTDVYSDDDYSGLYDDRPDFDRLINDAKLGKFNVIIAKSQSRFTRNMEHMEKYLHHDFPLLGIRFIGVVDGVDTQNIANKKSRQINGLVNEWYCEDLSNNIRAVFHQKMKAGQYLGGFAPYGYLKDPNDKYKFVIDEPAATIVKKIYQLFLSGYSDRSICHILEDEQIPNPTLYKERIGLTYRNVKSDDFSRKYGLWSTTTVKRILTNECYLGKLIQGTCKKASYKDKKVVPVPKDKWIVVDNHHEPIIDEETFQRVAKMRERRRISNVNQGKDKKIHVLAGKLRCAACGHTMIKSGGVRGRKEDWYLRCQLANKSRLKECTSHNIKYSTVADIVLNKIQEVASQAIADENGIEELAASISQSNENSALSERKKELHEIQLKIDNVTKSTKLLYIDRTNKKINDDMFFQIMSDFEGELQKFMNDKQNLESRIKWLDNKIKTKEKIGKLIKEHTNYSALTHELVNDYIDYIEIEERNKETDEQAIIIHWNF